MKEKLYEHDPYDVPEGQKVRFRETPDIRIYGIEQESASGFKAIYEIFATHRMWGPSDAGRGKVWRSDEVGDIEPISDETWSVAVDNV